MEDELEQFLNEENPFDVLNLRFDLGFITIEDNSYEEIDANSNGADNQESICNVDPSENVDVRDLVVCGGNEAPNEVSIELEISTEPQPKRRGRPSLNLSAEDRKERQKEVNRRAAQKYREKVKSHSNKEENSFRYQTKKNKALKAKILDLENQILHFKLSLNIV